MDKKGKEIRKSIIDAYAPTQQKHLPPEAQRALKEAAERRKSETNDPPPIENGGRGGKDPARYGDWELKGRAIDF
ncbi:DUF1674 domain-containing protein [Bartonella sp. A05]|uniref:DUF1674 domain-containing protein n=1 Tax=Bartonella sp. A05 TaxID=2967261 RepID=UPI0022A9BFFA|nr:DUF1674 domain-containing protein [Bartonella sp. A05]MCZ2203576.1 DUF1674 domain-containing protein [Bartonella sp. A05]